MANVRIEYTRSAIRDLKKLDNTQARRVIAKIKENAQGQDPLVRAKPLTGELAGAYRYRVGTYRVIFTISSDGGLSVLVVLTVQHRKDVYR